jgi:hypothetical protein
MENENELLSVSEITPSESPTLRTFARVTSLEQWLLLFGEAFNKELSELTIYAYLEALSDIPYPELHQACIRVVNSCKFMPTVAEIRKEWDRYKMELGMSEQIQKAMADRSERLMLEDKRSEALREQLKSMATMKPPKQTPSIFEPQRERDVKRFVFTDAPKSPEQQLQEMRERGLIH